MSVEKCGQNAIQGTARLILFSLTFHTRRVRAVARFARGDAITLNMQDYGGATLQRCSPTHALLFAVLGEY